MAKEFPLAGVPADGINAVVWTSASTIAGAYWDSTVRLHDAVPSAGPGGSTDARAVYRHKAPVLDVAPGPAPGTVLSGGLDMDVRMCV